MAHPPPLPGDGDVTMSDASSSSSDKKAAKKDIATVASYTQAVGMIIPPPDMKVIVDRTADFVRRVGRHLEPEIMQRNA